jgi:hypothetical protein
MSQRKRRPSTSRPTGGAGRDFRAQTAGSSPSGRTDQSRSRRATAAGGAGRVGEPHPSAARQALERASTPLLLRLRRLPPWLVPLIMLALSLTGLLVQGPIGFAALAVVAIFLGWLALLSWPVLKPAARALRVLAVGVVAAAAVVQLLV